MAPAVSSFDLLWRCTSADGGGRARGRIGRIGRSLWCSIGGWLLHMGTHSMSIAMARASVMALKACAT